MNKLRVEYHELSLHIETLNVSFEGKLITHVGSKPIKETDKNYIFV